MTPSVMTVSLLMTSPVVSLTPDTPLDAAYRKMAERRISCVPVVAADGQAVGVLSESDLLRVGRLQPSSLAGLQVLDLPSEPVSQHMHAGVITVTEDTPVTTAAARLVEHRIHRVFVAKDGELVGVFSTEEVLIALREKRVGTPIGDVMTTPVKTVLLDAPVSEAVAHLDHAGITGLAVVDEHNHPVGLFTRTEALKARNLAPGTRVEDVMSYAMLYQNARTPIFRAAAHAYETRTRRVLVLDGRKVDGVLAGLDFARVLAASASA